MLICGVEVGVAVGVGATVAVGASVGAGETVGVGAGVATEVNVGVAGGAAVGDGTTIGGTVASGPAHAVSTRAAANRKTRTPRTAASSARHRARSTDASIGRVSEGPKSTESEPDLAPPPDLPPAEELAPPEDSPDPRGKSRRRTAADPDAVDDAPHAADWFSSRGSAVAAAETDTLDADREALAVRIMSRLNPEQARAVTTTEGPLAHPCRRGIGQNPRAGSSGRIPDRCQGRQAVADPGRHVHQQGRCRDARADHRARRGQGTRRGHGYVSFAVCTSATARRERHRHRTALHHL